MAGDEAAHSPTAAPQDAAAPSAALPPPPPPVQTQEADGAAAPSGGKSAGGGGGVAANNGANAGKAQKRRFPSILGELGLKVTPRGVLLPESRRSQLARYREARETGLIPYKAPETTLDTNGAGKKNKKRSRKERTTGVPLSDAAAALFHGAHNGDADEVMEVLEAGLEVDVNVRTNADMDGLGTGATALHVAAMRGHEDVVSCLLQGRADANLMTGRGELALQLATRSGHLGVVRVLSCETSCATAEGALQLLKSAPRWKNDRTQKKLHAALVGSASGKGKSKGKSSQALAAPPPPTPRRGGVWEEPEEAVKVEQEWRSEAAWSGSGRDADADRSQQRPQGGNWQSSQGDRRRERSRSWQSRRSDDAWRRDQSQSRRGDDGPWQDAPWPQERNRERSRSWQSSRRGEEPVTWHARQEEPSWPAERRRERSRSWQSRRNEDVPWSSDRDAGGAEPSEPSRGSTQGQRWRHDGSSRSDAGLSSPLPPPPPPVPDFVPLERRTSPRPAPSSAPWQDQPAESAQVAELAAKLAELQNQMSRRDGPSKAPQYNHEDEAPHQQSPPMRGRSQSAQPPWMRARDDGGSRREQRMGSHPGDSGKGGGRPGTSRGDRGGNGPSYV